MNKPVSVAVIESGLIPDEVLAEMTRWGLPLVTVDESQVARSPEQVVRRIQEALEGEDVIRLRDTDLDMIRYYLTEQKPGRLHVEETSFDVFFCRTKLGEYVIPWKSESIQDMMVDPKTYLSFSEKTDGASVRHKVFFSDVRELYFGDTKAFMVCEKLEEK